MHFQITHYADDGEAEIDVPAISIYAWTLEAANGEKLCRSGRSFESEREARSNIAQVKRSMAGAGRYKVKSPDAA